MDGTEEAETAPRWHQQARPGGVGSDATGSVANVPKGGGQLRHGIQGDSCATRDVAAPTLLARRRRRGDGTDGGTVEPARARRWRRRRVT